MKRDRIYLFKIDVLLLIAILLSVAGSVCNLILPLFVRQFIDVRATSLMSFDSLLPILTVLMMGSIVNAVSMYLISVSGDRRIRDIRENIEEKLLKLPISFYKENASGELVSRIINDSLIIKEFTTNEVPNAIVSIITLIGSIGILLYLDLKLTLVIVLSFTIVAIIAYPLGKINEGYSFLIQDYLSKLSQVITENIQNIQIIELYNAQKEVKHKFKKINNNIYGLSKKIDKIFSITGPIQTMFTLLAFLIIVLYGSTRVSQHTLSMGILASFMMYIFEIITPINTLANFYVSYSEAKGASKVISRIMNTTEEKVTGKDINGIKEPYIEMKNISFKYGKKSSLVLKRVSVSFDSLKKIAIVGPSGAGKTTLISILTRLQEKYDGLVFLNGRNSKDYSLASWRSLFSVVTQENSIFSGSIRDNLTFGLIDKPSEEELNQALKVASMSKDIDKFPGKLDFDVGENGGKLSGGQRQKIQIARAYLRDTPFIIFDEATSNLDPESESEILSSIDELSSKKTLIVIAHRLSTIVNADKIYFLDNHQILGAGTHEELLRKVEKYKTFVNDQFISKE